MDKQTLINAICRSGGKQNALDEADLLWSKLDFLRQTGRYGMLLSQLVKANDISNLLALVLEANFAYQFESKNLELAYEVKQNAQQMSSIDFLRKLPSGENVYFELRLLRQTKNLTDSIETQLEKYGVSIMDLDENGERNEVVRIQNSILGKVQDKNGNPTKFFANAENDVNIVVIDASDAILGMIDNDDCRHALYGDEIVGINKCPQIFGLFQENEDHYPQLYRELAIKYAYVRKTLHGVLFLFKKSERQMLAYQLEHLLFWNSVRIDEAKRRLVSTGVGTAIPHRQELL